ncbi:MAG: hypothetical protein ACLUSL_08820 [Ruminococcus sp.]
MVFPVCGRGIFPAGIRCCSTIAVTLTWGCIGLWYGFRLPSLLWGIAAGLLLCCLEHAMGERRTHAGFRYLLVGGLLSVGSLLLTMPDLAHVWSYCRILLGMEGIMPAESDFYFLRSYGLALLPACYAATGHWRTLLRRAEHTLWFRRMRTVLTVSGVSTASGGMRGRALWHWRKCCNAAFDLRACAVSFSVQIFEHDFVGDKEKIRRHTVSYGKGF